MQYRLIKAKPAQKNEQVFYQLNPNEIIIKKEEGA